MTALPRILARRESAGTLSLDLDVPPGHAAFDGHFDEVAILPGVMQIDWAIRLACEHWSQPASIQQLSQLKFMQVIRPGEPVTLELRWTGERRELSFLYRGADHAYSSGKARLADV